MSAARRPTPPRPGMKPSDSSGNPKRARVPHTRRWQASAISSPPPRQSPFTAAMNGFGMAKRSSSRARPARACRTASSADGKRAIAAKSPPTENTRRRPVTMTTRTALGATIDRTSPSSAKSAGVRALTGGLSSRTTAVLPSITVSTSLRVSAIVPAYALQQGARGSVPAAQSGLQRGEPGLQERGIELSDLLERALVRANDLAHDGIHLLAVAQLQGDTAEILVDEAHPDPLRDVLSYIRPPCHVRRREQSEQARIFSTAPVSIQEDSALGLPSQVALCAQRLQDSSDATVVGDERRPLPAEDVEGDVDANEIEGRQRPHQHPRVEHPRVDGRRGDA